MVLDISTAVGAMTGARYIESLRDGREVWLDGEKVADVTTHPVFTGMVHELARIYDLQDSPEFRDDMTFVSADSGNRCSYSWLLPRSAADLKRKRRNSEIWNQQSWGQLGRSPDILAPPYYCPLRPPRLPWRHQAPQVRLRRKHRQLSSVLPGE